uniref:Secreted protein n=1 Tax=Anopheles darlingi TaxID=43151 RepID=A0A2M4DBW4_ANODA
MLKKGMPDPWMVVVLLLEFCHFPLAGSSITSITVIVSGRILSLPHTHTHTFILYPVTTPAATFPGLIKKSPFLKRSTGAQALGTDTWRALAALQQQIRRRGI